MGSMAIINGIYVKPKVEFKLTDNVVSDDLADEFVDVANCKKLCHKVIDSLNKELNDTGVIIDDIVLKMTSDGVIIHGLVSEGEIKYHTKISSPQIDILSTIYEYTVKKQY